MDKKEAKEILKKYNQGTCSPEEKEWVESWYLQIVGNSKQEGVSDLDMPSLQKDIWHQIVASRPIEKSKKKIYIRIAAAASLFIVIGLSFYFFQQNATDVSLDKKRIISQIQPGGNKAMLTLSNGTKINLADLEDGASVKEQGLRISKRSNGELIYEVVGENNTTKGNTIETPIGGQYQVVLPDGTKVWLNASSALEYPLNFSGNERRVVLRGEGYFEVKSDKTKPFRVVSENQIIEVLGTKFNINTYKDESSMKTTLLEGSVRIYVNGTNKLLKPGEQARVLGDNIEVEKVDSEQATAWYRGDFAFEGTELQAIMRQISRWYDVEVVYRGDIANLKFGGSISRSKDIKEVLKVLSLTQSVNFKLEGRRVFVMP